MTAQSPRPLTVLFASSECAPFAHTGGLGDVSAALPLALAEQKLEPLVLMPLYEQVDRRALEPAGLTLSVPMGASTVAAPLWRTRLRSLLPIYFVEHDGYYQRKGLYGPNGCAYDDNLERFVFLSRACVEFAKQLPTPPDILHANDWPTALVPLYLHAAQQQGALAHCASVFTIHNIGYQGVFARDQFPITGLGREYLSAKGLEHFGVMNLLKGGLHYATRLTTVSPTYAQEIQTSAYGCGLDGLIRSRRDMLSGILNGIDEREWDPSTDPFLPVHYSASDLQGKAVCKAELQKAAGFAPRPEVPLIGMITRLTYQKGMDVLAHALQRILELDVQLVLLGTGDPNAEAFFQMVSQRAGHRFHAWQSFDQALSHRIEAGCDFFLMPSRYEPCGLNQMYSLRYGTLPIVRATGGLDDTVENYHEPSGSGTGFKLHDLNPSSLFDVVGWAVSTWYDRPRHVRQMQQRAMVQDFSWTQAASQYAKVYEQALSEQQAQDLARAG